MRARLKGLQRVAGVYMTMKHAQALSLEQAAAAVREAEAIIERQRSQVRRTSVAGREALDAGEHEAWQMHESQNQFTERNPERLVELRERREALMLEAAAVYRVGRMQLEQMESVLGELRMQLKKEQERKTQRESDDRFLRQRWWRERGAGDGREEIDEG